MSRVREAARGMLCRVIGHRDLVTIRHVGACTRPDHADYPDERFCRYCDSGWLDEAGREQ